MAEVERQSIYFESGDEITSAVDKIKSAESNTLDIVIPKEALLLQSVVNLKLLKRQAESLGKEITIVTQDKVGTKLAEQIGIPVVAKEGDTPKEMNVSEQDDEKKPTEEDIELKEVTKKNEKAEPEAIEKTDEIVGEAKKVEPKTGKEKLKGWAWVKAHWKGVSVAAGFMLLLVAMAAYVYVPLARINITLAAQKESVDIIFVADTKTTNVDAKTQTIPAQKVEEEVEKTETFQATGEKDVGEKATGEVTIFNNYSTSAQNLSAGDKLIASGGKTFYLVSNVSIPGYTDPGSGKVAGSLTGVDIKAADVGDSYNLAKDTQFSIPKVNDSDFYAVADATFSGGSSKKVKYVTADDIAKGKESLEKSVETELKSKILDSLSGGQLLEDAMEIEEEEAKASVSSGAEKDSFSYTYKGKGTAIVFSQDDLLLLAEQVLANKIGDGREIVEKESLVSEAKFTKADFEAGTMNATLAGEAYIATKINEEEFKIQTAGVPEAEALEYINNIEGAELTEINFFPSFYKRVPRIKSHIYLKVEISKMQSTQTEDTEGEEEDTTEE